MITENDPVPGFYLVRLVKGGPLMPVKIEWKMSERVMCDECAGTGQVDVNIAEGVECDGCHGQGLVPTDDDLLLARVGLETYSGFELWLRCAGNDIGLREYNRRMADLVDTHKHARDRPEARPREPVNLATMPPITPGETK